jgi:hypothetical protein
MAKRNFKTTSIGLDEYKLAEKLADKDKRSVKGLVEVLIIREAKKEGIF